MKHLEDDARAFVDKYKGKQLDGSSAGPRDPHGKLALADPSSHHH